MSLFSPQDSIFETSQWVPRSRSEVFNFFSDAKNLERITPPWLSFSIKTVSTDVIEKDTLIHYRLKLHGIPISWQTRIDLWNPPEAFVDLQLKGPYSLWHHTHIFKVESRNGIEGTLMLDRVVYRLPFGILGQIVHKLYVRRDIEKIFQYRQKIIDQLFSEG